jgi:hypothetical protein
MIVQRAKPALAFGPASQMYETAPVTAIGPQIEPGIGSDEHRLFLGPVGNLALADADSGPHLA